MKAAFLGLLFIVGILATSCSGGADGGETLDLADIGWTENTAIAHLTKVLLEEDRLRASYHKDQRPRLSVQQRGQGGPGRVPGRVAAEPARPAQQRRGRRRTA